MHPRERLPYSPIEGRAPLKLPKGVRLVVWPVLQVRVKRVAAAQPVAAETVTP